MAKIINDEYVAELRTRLLEAIDAYAEELGPGTDIALSTVDVYAAITTAVGHVLYEISGLNLGAALQGVEDMCRTLAKAMPTLAEDYARLNPDKPRWTH